MGEWDAFPKAEETDWSAFPKADEATALSQQKPNALVDSIRVLPGGIAQGVNALAGLPGDVNDLLDSGANWIMSKVSGKPVNISTRSLPTTNELNKTVSEPFGGYYEPKTRDGRYTQTVASFLPAALAPGSPLIRAARVAVPAVASETAGEATKGSPWEPLARAGGALVGGLGLGALEAAGGTSRAAPTTEQLKKAKDAAYKAVDDAGVTFSGQRFRDNARAIAAQAEDAGLDPTLHPKASAALKRLTDAEGDLSFKKVETLRRVVNGAASSNEKDERRIAYIIRDGLDDFVESMDDANVLSGDVQTAAPAIKDARQLYSRIAKSDVVDRAIDKAKTRASQFTGSGYENALRTEFRKIAMNDRAMRRFSKEEQDAIRKVAEGTVGSNVARRLGAMAPQALPTNMSMFGGGAGAALGAYLGGPTGAAIGAFAPPAIGLASRPIATALTARSARQAGDVMRGGMMFQQPAANSASLLSDLLLSQAAHR